MNDTGNLAAQLLFSLRNDPWAMTLAGLASILDALESITDTAHGSHALSAVRGVPLASAAHVEVRNGVAVIPVIGPILRYDSPLVAHLGAVALESLAVDLDAAIHDRSIRAVLLNFDSPGGQAKGINELAQLIRRASERKPVAAYIGGAAASAAYWLASAAGEVVLSETAIVGAIGIVMQVQRDSPDRAISFVSSQSPRKQASPASESGRRDYQSLVDSLGAVFVETVARHRGTTPAKVAQHFGEGFVLTGRDAVAAGMADRLGAFEALLAELSRGRPSRTPTRSTATQSTAPATRTKPPPAAFTSSSVAVGVVDPHAAARERERVAAVEAVFQGFPANEQLLDRLRRDGRTTGPEAAALLVAEIRSRMTR